MAMCYKALKQENKAQVSLDLAGKFMIENQDLKAQLIKDNNHKYEENSKENTKTNKTKGE